MSLRQQVLKGGAYLVVRQALGIAIGLVGVLLLTRLIGPANYGVYAGSMAFMLYLLSVSITGVDVYILRRDEEPEKVLYDQAFTWLVATSVAFAALSVGGLEIYEAMFGDARFVLPLEVLLLVLPVNVLHYPAFTLLERALNYQAIAVLELSGQMLFYSVSVGLAAIGWGVWAPIVGYWVWQVWLVAAASERARLRPRFVWSRPLLREMLRYGFGYSASQWVWQLRDLVNPVVVGRLLGAEAVGYIALAVRLVDALAFVKHATWRLSIAAFAKVQRDYDRFRPIVEEAMALQVLVLGPILVGATVAAMWGFTAVFGEQWSLALDIFPFLALGALLNAVFNMFSSVLYVAGRNRDVLVFHAAHVALFATANLVLVPWLGLIGFGIAEIVAFLAYAISHWYVRKLFRPSYRRVLPWLLAFIPGLFALTVPRPWGLILCVPALVVLLAPRQRNQLKEYTSYFRLRLRGEGAS